MMGSLFNIHYSVSMHLYHLKKLIFFERPVISKSSAVLWRLILSGWPNDEENTEDVTNQTKVPRRENCPFDMGRSADAGVQCRWSKHPSRALYSDISVEMPLTVCNNVFFTWWPYFFLCLLKKKREK